MTRKNIQEIDFTSSQDRKSKSDVTKKRMLTVRCVCGCEILVVPDLKAMNRAIRDHVAEHKKVSDGPEFNSLEQFLTEQVLIVASEKNMPNVN